jgi:hypothetical protein
MWLVQGLVVPLLKFFKKLKSQHPRIFLGKFVSDTNFFQSEAGRNESLVISKCSYRILEIMSPQKIHKVNY